MIVPCQLLFFCIYAFLKHVITMLEPGSPYYWPDYVKNYSSYYDDLEETNLKRMRIYEENVKYIKSWNQEYDRGERNFELGVNFMSAMTKEEKDAFKNHAAYPIESRANDDDEGHKLENFLGRGFEKIEALYEVYKKSKESDKLSSRSNDGNDSNQDNDSLDWREFGMVSPVKFQGPCARCYAFSAVDAIESNYAIRTGELVRLSSQMVVDCSKDLGNDGCEGGWIHSSYDWLIKNRGIALEKDYPMAKKDGICKSNATFKIPIAGYITLPKDNQEFLKEALLRLGPIAVTINADPKTFESYKSYDGVYADPECDNISLSHTALVVGYGTENGIGYWLVKNSWGVHWGDRGYIKIKRDGNICGVMSRAYLPVLTPPPGGWHSDIAYKSINNTFVNPFLSYFQKHGALPTK